MADSQITCVHKTGTTHESITHLGGAGWCWTKAQVIESIEKGTNTFFTMENGKRAEVRIVQGSPKYVRTYADGFPTNNLLALPGCPR